MILRLTRPPSTQSVLAPLLQIGLLLSLTACGGSDDTPSPPSGDSAAVTTEAAQPRATDADEAGSDSTDDGVSWGPALEQPERYYGLFANPERPGREWFVTEARRPEYAERAPEIPPGHLSVGAMFGDVAPWHLRTVSETEFVQARVPDFQPEPVAVEFELDDDGRAAAMRFTSQDFASEGRLLRTGDLPDDW